MGNDMLALLRRDCLWFFLITIGFLSSAAFFFIGSTDDVNAGFRIYYLIGVLVICLPCFSLLSSELKESYRFLQLLPVSVTEIVAAKFLLVLAQVALFWALVLVLLVSGDWHSSDLVVGIGFINLCAILSLLLAASWYWGTFRYGFSMSTRIMSVVYFGIIVTVIYLADVFEGGVSELWVGSLSLTEWILLFVLTLVIYFLLMRVAIRAKIAGEIDQ